MFKAGVLILLTLISFLIVVVFGVVFAVLLFGTKNPSESTGAMLFIQSASSIGMFALPAVVFAILFKEDEQELTDFLAFNNKPDTVSVLLAVSTSICVLPFVGWLTEINNAIPLPEALNGLGIMDDNINKTLEKMLTGTPLVLQILIIAILPAICEELYFRAVVQNQIFGTTNLTPWACVLITGFIFSAIHMQFSGILPRFLLGSLLGFMLVLTKSLWTSIIFHFCNNFVAVVAGYVYGYTNNIEEEMGNYPVLIVVSIVLTVTLVTLIYKRNKLQTNNLN